MRKILILLAALSLCVHAEARKVSGTVQSEDEKLSGVIVTDGKNFTTTGRNGKFSFDIEDEAEFVYIVTPSGYAADWSSGVPAFYQKAKGHNKFIFNLMKSDDSEGYSIVAFADPQTNTVEHMNKFAGKPMEDLCETAKNLTGFSVGLALGDISWDNPDIFDLYKKEIVRMGIPVYPVVGNHDNYWGAQGDLEGAEIYRKEMGPENYAFFLGKDVVIVLDNIIYDTMYKHQCAYAQHVIEWTKGLAALLPEDAELYIAQHAPAKSGRGRELSGTGGILEAVKGHKVTFLSGHTHVNRFSDYGNNVTEHNIAAICGAWWETYHCTDGTPMGYKVFTKTGNDLTWYYKSVGHPEDHQFEVYAPGETELNPESIVVNIWDWNPGWKIEWHQDGVNMGTPKQVQEYSPRFVQELNEAIPNKEEQGWKRPGRSFHYFAATPAEGAKQIVIAIEDNFGRKWTHTMNL